MNFNGVESGKAIMADAVMLERISDIVADDQQFEQAGTAWETVESAGASGGSYRTVQNGDNGSRLSYRFSVMEGGGYRLRFFKPQGLDVSNMSKAMEVLIDDTSYSMDLSTLKDGYNTVAFCSLEEGMNIHWNFEKPGRRCISGCSPSGICRVFFVLYGIF